MLPSQVEEPQVGKRLKDYVRLPAERYNVLDRWVILPGSRGSHVTYLCETYLLRLCCVFMRNIFISSDLSYFSFNSR